MRRALVVIILVLISTAYALSPNEDSGLFQGPSSVVHYQNGTNDSDDDGLTDDEENDTYGTDPYDNDTDDDGYLDGEEVDNGWDPLDPNDPDPSGPNGTDAEDSAGAFGTSSILHTGVIGCGILLILVGGGLVYLLQVLTRRREKEHPRRDQLVEMIASEPGIMFSQLRSDTGTANGQITHHLGILESQGRIVSHRQANRRLYYVTGKAPDRELTVPEKILDHVRANPGISPSKLGKDLALSRQLVHYHLKRLGKKDQVRIDDLEDGMAIYPVRKLALEAMA